MSDDVPKLTSRQREVLELLTNGLTNREIAQRLYLSPNTVRDYVSQLLRKYEVRNRTELVQSATRFARSQQS